MRVLSRVLLTAVLVAAAYGLFLLASDTRTTTETVDESTTISTVATGGREFFEWVALFCLAMAVWMWRGHLNITSVGGMSWPAIEQQTPEEIEKERAEDSHAPRTFDEAAERLKEREFTDAKASVLDYLSTRHALTESIISRELRISLSDARALLTQLVEEGALRRDGFPRRTLYTSANSLENRAIDHVRDTIVARNYSLLAERRFVRIQRSHEIDAVLETEQRTFLVEVRYVHSRAATSQIERGQKALVQAAEAFRNRPIVGYLLLVVMHPDDLESVAGQVERVTFDDKGVPVQVLVLSAAELESDEGT